MQRPRIVVVSTIASAIWAAATVVASATSRPFFANLIYARGRWDDLTLAHSAAFIADSFIRRIAVDVSAPMFLQTDVFERPSAGGSSAPPRIPTIRMTRRFCSD